MTKVRTPNHADGADLLGYTPGHEGVAFVATLRGTPGRDVLDTALDALRNLHHDRSRTSGILTHIPHEIFKAELGAELPPAGSYAVGFVFHSDSEAEQTLIGKISAEEGFDLCTWREVPVNETIVETGPVAFMPVMRQVLLTPQAEMERAQFDAALYRIRKRVEAGSEAYFASLSRSTIVYKGLVPATRLALFYEDLANPDYLTEIAVVHSGEGLHYPSWCKAQPHRILAHDGQIHSKRSNLAWLRSRLPLIESDLLSDAGEGIRSGHLIEGILDEYIELLHRGGRSLTHALRLVFPEQRGKTMNQREKDFRDYSAMVMEPWEGSGVTCFADGYLVGAILDRHGTRGGRYWVTESGLVVFASETGVVDLDPGTITKKARLAPGEIIAVDTVTGNVLSSNAIRAQLASLHPYGEWLQERIPAPGVEIAEESEANLELYDVKAESLEVADALAQGVEDDESGAVSRQLTFFDRFRSIRYQLTSPYIDAIAMSTEPELFIGAQSDVLIDGPEHARKVVFDGPAISSTQVNFLCQELSTARVGALYDLPDGKFAEGSLADCLEQVYVDVDQAIAAGAQVIVLSNRGARDQHSAPVPSLLLVGAVHQRLLDAGTRAKVSLVVEAGDAVAPIEVAQLLEAGAQAVAPFHGEILAGPQRASTYFRLLNTKVYQRLLRTGVAEYDAYQGSRRFHIVGLDTQLVDLLFTGVRRALGTFGLDDIGRQNSAAPSTLEPLQELLHPTTASPIDIDVVETVESLHVTLAPRELLEFTDTRKGVDLFALAQAKDVLLVPPAHHDTVGPAGLSTLIDEIRMVNPGVRVHVSVGADLSSDITALEALAAGADVINLVDAEYEWVFGLLSLRQSTLMERAHIAVAGTIATARDVFIAAALGAKEFRLAQQADPYAVAHELRLLLASAGIASLADLTGRIDLLEWSSAVAQWRGVGVDLAAVGPREHQRELPNLPTVSEDPLDETLAVLAHASLDNEAPARINTFVTNTDASVGAYLAGEVARRYGPQGLGPDTIRITLTGSSGVSLGAYAAPGMSIIVQGEAGDFVGKGLSGGKVAARPEASAGFASQENVIAGSAVGYGAQSGGIYLAGGVGERLGAHNWGATIVCEGAGDAAGYRMHAGTVVILGAVGDNLGAGMEGGVIYALDLDPDRLHEGSAAGELTRSELSELDLRELTAIIAEHVELTNSRIGTMILADPEQLETRFTKVLITED